MKNSNAVMLARLARARQQTAQARQAFRAAFKPLEVLESRTLLSGVLYVNDNWHADVPLTVGVTVDNTGAGDDGSLHGLTFGTDAFDSLAGAVAAAGSGDLIVVVSGSYSLQNATLDKAVTVLGWEGFVADAALPAENPDPAHLTPSAMVSLPSVLSQSQVGVNLASGNSATVRALHFTNITDQAAVLVAGTNAGTVTVSGNSFSANSDTPALIANSGIVNILGNTFAAPGAGVFVTGGSAAISGNHLTLVTAGTLNAIAVAVVGGSATVSGNLVDAATTRGLIGVLVSDNGALYGAASGPATAVIAGNTISGAHFSVGIDGSGADLAQATVTGNTLTGDTNGVFLNGDSCSALIAGNFFSGASTAVNIGGGTAGISGNTFSGNTYGIVLDGGMTGTLTGNRFDTGAANQIDVSVVSVTALTFGAGNRFGGAIYFVDNSSPTDFTLTGQVFGTRDTATLDARMHDGADEDNPGAGLLTYSAALTLDTLTPSAAVINEGDTLTLTGTYADQGAADPHSLTINWGDGSAPQTVAVSGGAFSVDHVYGDNRTAGISAQITAIDGATSSVSTATVTVLNVAPALSATFFPLTIYPGGTATVQGTIVDPGATDTFTVPINWGPGETVQFLTLGATSFNIAGISWDAATRHFSATHKYRANNPTGSSFTASVYVYDNSFATSSTFSQTINVAYNTVAGQYLFYKGSAFDTGGHDNAIATDKIALLPGQTAGFANYSSFTAGINGLMIDINGTVNGLTASDFVLSTGNDNVPADWPALGVTPTVTIRPGAGVGNSTRIELTFADGAIKGTWLQVTVLANAHTGLQTADHFFFGNAPGDSGNSTSDTKVTAIDELAARFGATPTAAITHPLDFNRDGAVDGLDEQAARANYTWFANEVLLISPPADAAPAALPGVSGSTVPTGTQPTGTLPAGPTSPTVSPTGAAPATSGATSGMTGGTTTGSTSDTTASESATGATVGTAPGKTRKVRGAKLMVTKFSKLAGGMNKLGVRWLRR